METKYFNSKDNRKIAYIERYNKNSKIGIILVHGLAEHKGRYEEFYEKIFDLGFSVFAMDIRGHGLTEGKKGYVNDFQTFLSDIDVFIKNIKSKYPNLKIALLGHSLGGLIATSYSAITKLVDYLILSNPLLCYTKLKVLFNLVPYRFLGFIKIKKRHSESREMLQYSYNDPLACKFLSLRLLGSIFKEGLSFVSKNYACVKVPTLFLRGEIDPVIKIKDFEKILSKFGTTDIIIKVYKNVKHRLLQSEMKDDVIKDIADWLNEKMRILYEN